MRDEIVSMRQDGASYDEIAVRLGVTRGFVAGHLYRERKGIAPRVPLGLSRAEVEQELDANGNNRAAAARKFGVHRSTIDRMTDRISSYRKAPRATDPATLEVLALIAESGMTDIEVADRAGIGVRTISTWRSGVCPGKVIFLEWVREAINRS